jgi:pimeloyl-ACP methyl ester carboxylesterase
LILISKTYWGGAPFHFRTKLEAEVEPLLLKAQDRRELCGLYWTPRRRPRPKLAVVCMHPRADFSRHYTFPRLLAAGIGCLGASTRNPNNDTNTIHEEIILDVAACVRFLKERRGVETVILLGNSGGGSLNALFQAQACKPKAERIARTPGGARTKLPELELIPADAMIYVSAHRGEGKIMNECIDPAVVDERDPLATDDSLDMYNPANGFRPPPQWSEYAPEFVARYRAAQLDRVRRLDAIAREKIAATREAKAALEGPDAAKLDPRERQQLERRRALQEVMVIYRTMANLHYVDRHLDPSPRDYGSLFSERPDLMNMQLLGFGRLATPHAWLSTWSGLSSNADLVKNVAEIDAPTLVVNAGRDREIYPRTDAEPIFAAVAAPDKTFVELPEARHYFEPEFGQREAPQVEALMDRVLEWIRERFAP